MSSFFGDLQGFAFPESIWNRGPLPSGTVGPMPQVQINYGSALLGDIRPYKYGEPSHVGDQANMLNTPHKIQKIVPQLLLPDTRDGRFALSHAVDDGDIAFVLRVNRNAGTIQQQNTFDRLELGRIVDPFVNLITVNYLLAGIQRYWHDHTHVHWQQLMVDTDFMPPLSEAQTEFGIQDALRFVNEIARPFGICHGSEMQGGQHEGGNGPVTWPVNFITSMAVSGRVENLVNLWRDLDIDAGNDLILRFEWLPIAAADHSLEYVLNHWELGTVRQRFDWDHVRDRNWAWQLVPDKFSLEPPLNLIEDYDWRENGYWHICRSQIMKGAEITAKLSREMRVQKCYLDDSRLLRGSVLEINFEPVFVRHRKLLRRYAPVRAPVPRAPNRMPHPFIPVPGGGGVNGGGAGGGGGNGPGSGGGNAGNGSIINAQAAPAQNLPAPPVPPPHPFHPAPVAPANAAVPVVASANSASTDNALAPVNTLIPVPTHPFVPMVQLHLGEAAALDAGEPKPKKSKNKLTI